MFKRVLFIMMMLFVLLLPTAAQDLIFPLDGTFTVDDLNITFPYPTTWLFSAANGIGLAETQADIDAMMDDDSATIAEGYTIQFAAVAPEFLGLEADVSLDAFVDALIIAADIVEVERAEIAVITNRTIAVFGTGNAIDRAAIVTVWQQNGQFVVASFGAATLDLINEAAFTWGALLGSIQPILPEAVVLDETLEKTDFGITLPFPTGWTPIGNDAVIIEKAEDEAILTDAAAIPVGHVVAFGSGALTDLGLEADSSLADIRAALESLFPLAETARHTEMIILDAPAYELWVSLEDGRETFVLLQIVDDTLQLTFLGSPDAETAAAIRPVWFAMLKGITAIEE